MLIPAISIGVGFFSILFVLTAARGTHAGRLLVALILVLTLPHLVHIIEPVPQSWPRLLHSFMGNHAFLLGPLLYLFVMEKVEQTRRLRAIDAVHFLPFLLSVVSFFVFKPAPGSPPIALLVILFFSVAGYTVASIYRISDSLPDPLYNYGIRTPARGHILQWTVGMTGFLWTAQVLIHAWLPHREGAFFRGLIIIAYTVCTCYIAILFLLSLQRPDSEPSVELRQKGRYERSGLKEDQSADLMRSIVRLMRDEEPFLDPNFSPADLAVSLQIPIYQISQVINQETGANFYTFANGYRIDHVVERLRQTEESVNLLHLALNAGFNSKSTFNSAFKKATGMTPSEYYRSMKDEKSLMPEGA